MTSAWVGKENAKKDSWADDVEAEAEAGGGKIEAPPADNAAFPSLGEAAKQAPKQKKKGQKMDMRTFMQQAGGPPAPSSGRFVPTSGRAPVNEKEILLSLPTGSKGRVEGEEDAGPPGMGGAFRDYGGDRAGGWKNSLSLLHLQTDTTSLVLLNTHPVCPGSGQEGQGLTGRLNEHSAHRERPGSPRRRGGRGRRVHPLSCRRRPRLGGQPQVCCHRGAEQGAGL
jgi:hypothetical protein